MQSALELLPKTDAELGRIDPVASNLLVAKGIPSLADPVWHTDPSGLFLNGVIDTRRGTCGNMSALFVALCWRPRWRA